MLVLAALDRHANRLDGIGTGNRCRDRGAYERYELHVIVSDSGSSRSRGTARAMARAAAVGAGGGRDRYPPECAVLLPQLPRNRLRARAIAFRRALSIGFDQKHGMG